MVEESASVLTPPGKKMKQARLPFAPVNKQSTEGGEEQRKRKLSDAAAATPEPKTSKIEKQVEYEEVGAEYVKDSTLENNGKSKTESKVGELKENVCKRTVKAKKAKPEVEVVQLDEDSVQERPETMKGRVKLAFKKNGKKEKKNSEKKTDTDSDIELLTGDEKDSEDTSMTEDWAKFHQQEMEKNPGEGHTDKIESLVTPKDEKKHKKPKPVSESTKSEEKPNLEPEPTKLETGCSVTEPKTPKGAKPPNSGAKTPKSDPKTPKSDSKTAPKANPLAKFLVKMKPGAIPSKPKKTETAATNDDEIEIIEVKENVEKDKKVHEKEKKITKQKNPKASVDEKVEEIKTDDSKANEFETNESKSDESKTIKSKIDDSTIEKPKIDTDLVAVDSSANVASASTPVNKKVQGLKTPGGQGTPETPASIRAEKIALTRIRVKITELNIEMEEAVKEENFLKAHDLKLKIQSLEADLEKVQKDEPGTPSTKVESTPGSKLETNVETVSTPGSVGTRTPGSVSTPTSGSVGTPFTTPGSTVTPAPKSKSAKKVMTPGEEVSPASLRKLTPKQLALQEKRRKKMEEDKEEKEKKRMELKAQKEKERLEKEEEKSKEKRRKEIERIDKEQQRKEKEREKEKEKKEKEEERLKKKEEKEAEQKKKDEEKAKAEEAEAERKKKAAQAFKGFFVKKDAVKEVKPTDEEKMEEVAENMFNPFQIKQNMRLAPLVRNDTVAAMRRIDSLEEPVGPDGLYVKLLRDGKHTPGKQGKTWPWEKVEEDTDIEIVEEEEEEEEDLENMDEGVMILQSRVGKNPRAKLIQFHENQRPAYWGTWSKQSSAVTGRKPFSRDIQVFDYEYDSDEDWEDEGEGESLSDAEDEKEEEDDYEVDNEFFVPHGYLSDEEEDKDEDEVFNPEKEKEKLKLKEKEFQADYKKKTQQLKPRLWGCYWEEDTMEEIDTNAAAQQLVKILSGYAAITCCNNNLPIATSFSQPQSSPQPLMEDGGDHTRSGKGKNKVSKVFPEDALLDLVRLLHINSNNKIFLAREFIEFWNKKSGVDAGGVDGVDDVGGTPRTPATQLISKRRIVDKIQEIAEYKKLKGRTGRFWLVKEEIRNKVGLEQTETNTWNYILEQPNAKPSAPSEDVALSRPSSPVQSRINSPNPASLITKFTKVLTEEERAQNLSRANQTPPNAKRRKLTPSSVGQLSENPNQSKNTPATTPVNMLTVKRAPGSKPVNRIQPRKTPNTIKTTQGKSPLRVKSFALETPPKAAAPAALDKFASAAPIAFRKAPKSKAGVLPVTTVAGAFSQLKNLQGVTVTSVGKPGDDDDCITLD